MTSRGSFVLVVAVVIAMPAVVVVLIGGGSSSAPAPVAPPAAGGGTLRPGTVPAQYVAFVQSAGSLCATAPAPLIAAQIEQESDWNPHAVSPVGAEGISQFMPGTWATWGPPGTSPFDPAAAIPTQGKYDCAIAADLSGPVAAGRLGPITLQAAMLCGYNTGEATCVAAGGIPQNGQTPHYVAHILARMAYFTAPSSGGGSPPPAGSFAQKEIAAAKAELGVPYAWGGGTPTGPSRGICAPGAAWNDCNIVGFDCSGLVLYAVAQASGGADILDHSANDQISGGKPVSRADMQPGDLIGFTDPGATSAHHIGIYLGGNQMVDAPDSGSVVRIDSLATPYYQQQLWRVARYG